MIARPPAIARNLTCTHGCSPSSAGSTIFPTCCPEQQIVPRERLPWRLPSPAVRHIETRSCSSTTSGPGRGEPCYPVVMAHFVQHQDRGRRKAIPNRPRDRIRSSTASRPSWRDIGMVTGWVLFRLSRVAPDLSPLLGSARQLRLRMTKHHASLTPNSDDTDCLTFRDEPRRGRSHRADSPRGVRHRIGNLARIIQHRTR